MNEKMGPTQALPGLVGGRWFARAVTLLGPVLTVAVIASKAGTDWLRHDQVPLVLAVALLFWFPPFFTSVPALLTQDIRDNTLPELSGVAGSTLRAVVLVPWLLLSPKSPIRVETAMSLAGFTVGVLAALTVA